MSICFPTSSDDDFDGDENCAVAEVANKTIWNSRMITQKTHSAKNKGMTGLPNMTLYRSKDMTRMKSDTCQHQTFCSSPQTQIMTKTFAPPPYTPRLWRLSYPTPDPRHPPSGALPRTTVCHHRAAWAEATGARPCRCETIMYRAVGERERLIWLALRRPDTGVVCVEVR